MEKNKKISIITPVFNGEKYICLINGCVWDPITYPAGWQKVTETAESEVSK